MNIIIPMAGLGSRFIDYGFTINKYMLPINNKLETMIEKAISTVITNNDPNNFYIFIIRDDHDNQISNELSRICNKYNYNFVIKHINFVTNGPATTVYLAKDLIKKDLPIIISNSDQILQWNSNKFIEASIKYDGFVLTYEPDYPLQLGTIDKHSFLKFNNEDIIDVSEKIVLSNTAIIGVHYYKNYDIFIESYEYMVSNNIRAPNNEFYLSLTYKAMLYLNYKIGHLKIDQINDIFYPVGEPYDYFKYLQLNYKWTPFSITNNYTIIENDLFYLKIIKNNNEEENGTIIYNKKGSSLILSNEFSLIFYHKNHTESFQTTTTDKYFRNWFIGNFDPCIFKTSDFEIGYLLHKKEEKWPFHYHKFSDEYNFLISGSMILNNIKLTSNSFFIIKKNEIASPKFLEDCRILCIKIPSIPNDKIII